jgi:hypothetical protein
VQHGGEQLHLAVQDAAEPLPVDRDRGQQAVEAVGAREVAQPAADQVVEEVRSDGLDQGTDPRLARDDDPPQQRMRPPAEPAQYLLGQVGGMVSCLPEVPGPGQCAGDGDRQDEDEQVAAAAPFPRVRDPLEHLQQAGNFPGVFFIGAGHGSIGGMRN